MSAVRYHSKSAQAVGDEGAGAAQLPGPEEAAGAGNGVLQEAVAEKTVMARVALHFCVTRSSAEACKNQLHLSSSHLVLMWREVVASVQLLLRTQAGPLSGSLHRKAWQQRNI